jgi:hypothetical protein
MLVALGSGITDPGLGVFRAANGGGGAGKTFAVL